MTSGAGIYFDGMTSARHDVAVVLSPDALQIAGGDGRWLAAWTYDELEEMAAPANVLRLGRRGNAVLERLEIFDAEFAAAVVALPTEVTSPVKFAFVVTVAAGKYPQDIALECVQEKVNLLDGLDVGQTVTVTFDIRGREYNGRYFNNLQALRISAGEGTNPADGDGRPPIPPDFEDTTDYGDTIPF